MKLTATADIYRFCAVGDVVEDVTTAVAFSVGPQDVVLKNKDGRQIIINKSRLSGFTTEGEDNGSDQSVPE